MGRDGFPGTSQEGDARFPLTSHVDAHWKNKRIGLLYTHMLMNPDRLVTFVKLKRNHNVTLCRVIPKRNTYCDFSLRFIHLNVRSREP